MVSRNQRLDRRMNWFDRQFLRAQDFADEQDYHLDRRRRHLRQMHTSGITEGLVVNGDAGDSAVTVDAGGAVDDLGNEIVLLARTADIVLPTGPTSARLWVQFAEVETDEATDPGVTGFTRVTEVPRFVLQEIAPNPAPPPTAGVPLAVLSLDQGTLTDRPDNTDRPRAGTVLGEASVDGLVLESDGVPAAGWARMSSGEGTVRFLTGEPATERMRIGVDGTVAIGTTQPFPGVVTVAGDIPLSLSSVTQPPDIGGLWRLSLEQNGLAFQNNTAPTADFSEIQATLTLRPRAVDVDGGVTIRNVPPDDVTPADTSMSLVTRGSNGGEITWRVLGSAGLTGNLSTFDVGTDQAGVPFLRITEDGTTILNPSGGNTIVPAISTLIVLGNLDKGCDESLKDDIRPLGPTSEQLQAVRAVRFRPRPGPGLPAETDRERYGVVAQELEQAFPELVSEYDGIKTVDFSGLCAVLLEAVNELRAEVTGLRDRVAALENQDD